VLTILICLKALDLVSNQESSLRVSFQGHGIMRKTVIILAVCAFSSASALDGTPQDRGTLQNGMATHSSLQRSADMKKCITKVIRKCVAKIKGKLECRTQTVCLAVRG
jgi:hypothetical protein